MWVIFGHPADKFVIGKVDIGRIFVPDDVHLNDSGVQFSVTENHPDFGSGRHKKPKTDISNTSL